MKRIKLDFGRYSDASLLVLVQAIHAALTGNTFFPTTNPTLPDFLLVINAYANALSAAQNRGKEQVAAKNARRFELEGTLFNLALDIMKTADGNEEMLASTGFPLTKDRQPQPPIGIPSIAKVEVSDVSGEVKLVLNPLPGALTFVNEYTQDPIVAGSVWDSQNSSTLKATISGLETGKRYWFRSIAYGKDNQRMVSDPVLSKIVQ